MAKQQEIKTQDEKSNFAILNFLKTIKENVSTDRHTLSQVWSQYELLNPTLYQ